MRRAKKLKSSCQPLSCEATPSTYSTGWGTLAAPYLMAASVDVKAVALVSMSSVLGWNPCRTGARRQDGILSALECRETRVWWLRDRRGGRWLFGALGDAKAKRESLTDMSRRNFGLSRIQGPRGREKSRTKGRAQIWRGERRNEAEQQLGKRWSPPNLLPPSCQGQRAAMLPCTLQTASRSSVACRPSMVLYRIRYLSAAISPTVITPSSYAQQPTSVSFLDIEMRCHIALWRYWIFAPCPNGPPFRSFLVSPDRVLFSSGVESGPAIRQWHRDPGTGGVHHPLQHSSESVSGRGHLGLALSRYSLGGWNPLLEGHFPPSTQCSGSQINSATIEC
jgi:hypothetical protein